MLVYTMGPVVSRPFTNALHASVGVGFLAATFLVQPFLPEDSKASEDRVKRLVPPRLGSGESNYVLQEAVCNPEGAGATGGAKEEYEAEYLGGIQKIAWLVP